MQFFLLILLKIFILIVFGVAEIIFMYTFLLLDLFTLIFGVDSRAVA